MTGQDDEIPPVPPRRPRVFVGRSPDYDIGGCRRAVEAGLDFVDVRLRGNVVAKANWVLAHRSLATAAATRPELVKGALDALFARNPSLFFLFSGNSGLGVATRRMAFLARGENPLFRRRGYWTLPRIYPGKVAIRPTDEARYYRYQLSVGERMTDAERQDPEAALDAGKRWWDRVVTGWELYHADSVVFFPKLKSNVLSHGMSGAVKLQGIGFLRDGDRLDGHNWNNDRRIADMLEVSDPDLVVTDAVDIGLGGNQMTQPGHRLGAVLVADNAVAHDAVAAHILGLDPSKIGHLRIASERGFGPLQLREIDVAGDADLDELRARVRGFGHNGFMRVQDFPDRFQRETGHPFPIEIQSGTPYDVPGNQGLLLDWLYMAWDHPSEREKMKRWPEGTVRVGDSDALPRGSPVWLVGDRAIASFRRAARVRTLLRLPRWLWKSLRGVQAFLRYRLPDGRGGWALELPGDPPSHRDLVLGFWVGSLGRMRAPLMRLDMVLESYLHGWRTAMLRHRRNRDGIRVVHARKIERLRERPWRRNWGPSPLLELRDEEGSGRSP